MVSPTNWARNNIEVYFSNATARRDFRTQLRGNKPIILWSSYLLLLMIIGVIIYSALTSFSDNSLASMQLMLSTFAGTILMLLTVGITLIAPSLTAASIAGERQRKSLDLVLTTPIELKHYLVGKLIASYRYTWMLLLLALPLVSMCVILGGATWIDILYAFIYLSIFGVLFTAIGLLCSVLAPRPISAVVYTYVAVIAYFFLTSLVADYSGMIYGTSAGFTNALNPLVYSFTSGATTPLFGFELPVWIPIAVIVALLTKLLLLGAGSALSGYGSKETKSLRVHCVLYAALGAALGVYSLAWASSPATYYTPYSSSGMSPSAPPNAAIVVPILVILLHWIVPFTACYSRTAERKYQPDGVFSARGILLGTPSGALPFWLLVVLAATLSSAFTLSLFGGAPNFAEFTSKAVWAAGFITFVWSLARWSSSQAYYLTTARGIALLLLVCVLLVPIPILDAISAVQESESIWEIHPLTGGFGSIDSAMNSGLVLVAVGSLIAAAATWNDKRRQSRLRL